MDWRAHIARFGDAPWPGAPWARWSLVGLLVLGAVLRFWDLPHLPYTHDELSALVRLYPTLSETITTGVAALDTHPPGVQVFEWLWTRLFTMEEADVKLPFILMSLAAIALLYRFAVAWTGEGAALTQAALMTVLQYAVFYGQLARPYAAGLFTTALLADQLTRHLASGSRRALLGAGLAAVLSAYTHHFALLLAALMAGSVLLLLPRNRRKAYGLMCGAAVLAYLPNLPIFLKQLSQGGLGGWLPPPDGGWLARYASYLSHDDGVLGALMAFGIAASLFLAVRHGGASGPARWLLPLWGAAPLIIGYAYSVWRAPVLQYSVVLFSFPYFALFLLQGLRHLDRRAAVAGVLTLAAVGTASLAQQRKHFVVTYHSTYEAILTTALNAHREAGAEGALLLIDAPAHLTGFYQRLWGGEAGVLPLVNIREGWSAGRLDSLLAENGGKQVVYGRSNGAVAEHAALIQHRFPRLVDRRDFAEGQVFRFSSIPVPLEWFDRDTVAHIGSHRLGPWRVDEWLPRLQEAGWDYTGFEFGIAIDLPLDSLVQHRDDQLELIAVVDGFVPGTKASIVADVRQADTTVFYRTGDLDAGHRPAGPVAMAVAISPGDVLDHQPGRVLRAYVYSPDKSPLRIRSVTLMRRTWNPLRDAVLHPIPWLGRFPPE